MRASGSRSRRAARRGSALAVAFVPIGSGSSLLQSRESGARCRRPRADADACALPRVRASAAARLDAWSRSLTGVPEPAAAYGPDSCFRNPVDLGGACGFNGKRSSEDVPQLKHMGPNGASPSPRSSPNPGPANGAAESPLCIGSAEGRRWRPAGSAAAICCPARSCCLTPTGHNAAWLLCSATGSVVVLKVCRQPRPAAYFRMARIPQSGWALSLVVHLSSLVERRSRAENAQVELENDQCALRCRIAWLSECLPAGESVLLRFGA